MALSSVRAYFNGRWYTLQYNSSTRAYEVEITPSDTSANEPGGVYNATVEIKNDSGITRTYDESIFNSLKLKVKERVKPVLTLISPTGPYITEKRQTFIINATDEAGGSRINPNTITLVFDGASVSFSKTSISMGYEIRYTPSSDLTVGNHTLRATVKDYDGNLTELEMEFMADREPPVLTLISPTSEYVTEKRQTFVIHATDEDGGSGINPDTITFSFDGVSVSFVKTEISGGYEIRYTPSTDLTEGSHTARVTAEDFGGNFAYLDMEFVADTAPPVLKIHLKKMRQIVDVPTSTVYVEAYDTFSGLASLTVNGQPPDLIDAENNLYKLEVPLDIGRNDFEIVATDVSGQSSTEYVRIMRMITDRVKYDVYYAKNPPRKPLAEWTAADHEKWRRDLLYGCYDDVAMNRVCDAVRLMLDILDMYGFWAIVDPKPYWDISDAPTTNDYYLRRYISDVDAIQCSMPVILNPRIPLPRSLEETDYKGANAIEKALVNIDANLKALIYDLFSAKEISAGED